MKKIICKNCNQELFIQDSALQQLQFCPFCGTKIKTETEFENFDSLDKLIYSIIKKSGTDILAENEITRFYAFMDDLAPSLQKEIRIFQKNIYGNNVDYARQIITSNSFTNAQATSNKLRFLLIDYEGLSESWADLICNSLLGVFKYLNGEAPKELNVQIEDYTQHHVIPKFDSEIEPRDKSPASSTSLTSNSSQISSPNIAQPNRQSTLTVGDMIEFGSYPYYENGAKKPIQWRVLKVEKDQALLITKYGIDAKPFEQNQKKSSWDLCSLRTWLNNVFYRVAFNNQEQMNILTMKVTADINPHYDTNQGNDTKDKVFLLSVYEAKHYFTSDKDRQTVPTPYANKHHEVDTFWEHSWWLRSSGGMPLLAANVYDGPVDYYGAHVKTYLDVRPAIWIKIPSQAKN